MPGERTINDKKTYDFSMLDATIIEKKEVPVAKRVNYKGDKRRKETDRLKKQEEKRQRRFAKGREGEGEQTDSEEDGISEVEAG